MLILDHIAIPDFAAGAMVIFNKYLLALNPFFQRFQENWGLVTYRQTQYLYQEGITTQGTEEAIASTVVHEIGNPKLLF